MADKTDDEINNSSGSEIVNVWAELQPLASVTFTWYVPGDKSDKSSDELLYEALPVFVQE